MILCILRSWDEHSSNREKKSLDKTTLMQKKKYSHHFSSFAKHSLIT